MKPSSIENKQVWVEEMLNRMAKLEQEQQAQSEAEKRRLKEMHWMHCPKCGQKLAPETCGSVEMDVCPSCKGVWLDVGELETIVESAGPGRFFQSLVGILRGGRSPVSRAPGKRAR